MNDDIILRKDTINKIENVGEITNYKLMKWDLFY